MKTIRRIIIKMGTTTLTKGTQQLSRDHIWGLVQQMAHLQSRGIQLILVSSGAIATGRDLLSSNTLNLSHPKQALASVGQVKLIQIWSELFAQFNLQVGQLLLTKDDFALCKRHITREILECLLQHKIIPILNENDTVATENYCVGNNDKLAALIASLIGADTVILLTDQNGLYTADPQLTFDAKLIPIVHEINEKICAFAGGSSSSLGTGGMATKVEAAKIAAESGIKTIIASSFLSNVLIDLMDGKQIGTVFLEKTTNYKEDKIS